MILRPDLSIHINYPFILDRWHVFDREDIKIKARQMELR